MRQPAAFAWEIPRPGGENVGLRDDGLIQRNASSAVLPGVDPTLSQENATRVGNHM